MGCLLHCIFVVVFFWLGELLPESHSQIAPTTFLMWGDIAVDSRERPLIVKIRLKRSKCDQFVAGADIILGRSGHPLCPVMVILKYIEVQGSFSHLFFSGF